ncbi:MAG: AMP-binding protein [Gammaproteobacteria bacterium]|nr:AMP-binding protein [Gammaproteobacteria bacterium]MDH5261581.1 AMP-binding protein [Gammaproteobacteria bacterium]
MHIDFLRKRFAAAGRADAVIWHNRPYSYEYLLDSLNSWNSRLSAAGVGPGAVVSVEADFSPSSTALMLALIERSCIFVPLSSSIESKKPEFREIAQAEWIVSIDAKDIPSIRRTETTSDHPIIGQLKNGGHPGLVLFSSGSTGQSKAAVHDFVPMLEKYKVPRHSLRTITFLLFDHIGGVNTLLYSLSNSGCVVTVEDRRPETICKAIQEYHVELLPTSPTFLNLVLVSEAYKKYDLASLKTVTYGTEVMPESTLTRFRELFPNINMLQTYGLSEVGILRSKSRSSDSLWVKVGGEGFETRVVDGLLEIKAKSAMLGYLNAPSPFTDDGWFMTGDAVEVDGEFIKILGRRSELINIGGEKVYPAEVESVIQLMTGVDEVIVTGEKHPLTGNIVVAKIKLSTQESLPEFRRRLMEFCRTRLSKFMIPQKIVLANADLHGERFKKMRRI